MKTVNLILAFHNHQPIGNFESVFARAFDKAYRPLMDLVEQYPRIRVTQHYSGILLEWLKKHQPGFLRRMAGWVKEGRVEPMGGAYYEAILPIIPEVDRITQIRKLSSAVQKEFGAEPEGLWLAERVWEQHLTRWIVDAGLRYVAVDDTHFRHAGFEPEELTGYFLTEDQGRTLAVFPISKALRYAIPFQPVERTIEFLRSRATEDGRAIVVFADDGEKFGIWPKTFDHVYGSGWLADLFKALSDHADWIRIIHFGEALRTLPPSGRTYLPDASYDEMMQWALPVRQSHAFEELIQGIPKDEAGERQRRFLKGGFWRNFLVKYPEANVMYRKMLRVSSRAADLKRKRKKVSRSTEQKILAAQCNDPYWHGVFGGLYLPVLRYPVFRNLIAAESDLDRVERQRSVTWEMTDLDGDGSNEILIETPELNCYLKPDAGGSIFELDFKSISLNLLDIISRREESYHRRLAEAAQPGAGTVASIHDVILAKEPGLEKELNYDWYRHGSLIDHFFGPQTTLDGVRRCAYPEIGDFVNGSYAAIVRRSGASVAVTLSRDGAVWNEGAPHRLRVTKTLAFEPGRSDLVTEYRIENGEDRPVDLWFGVEFCVGLQAGDEPDRYYHSEGSPLEDVRLRSTGELAGIRMLGMRDEWLGADVQIGTGTPATFWRFPLETISLSEEGFERIFQSSVVIPHWRIRLESGKHWEETVTHRFRPLNNKGRHP